MKNMKIVNNGVWLLNEEFLTRCIVMELLVSALEKLMPLNGETIASAAIDEAVKIVSAFSQEDIERLVKQYCGKENERTSV